MKVIPGRPEVSAPAGSEYHKIPFFDFGCIKFKIGAVDQLSFRFTRNIDQDAVADEPLYRYLINSLAVFQKVIGRIDVSPGVRAQFQ